MKKLFTLIAILSLSYSSFSQTVLLQNNFDGYAGTIGSIAPGWYYSYNDSAATKSFYTSTGNFGASAPSYKFGRDSTTIITPRIFGAPDYVSFWMKGNGSSTSLFSLQNTFYIYESTDSINWTESVVIDSLVADPTSGSTDSTSVTFPLSSTTAFVKFFYKKFVGNIAFDNLSITGIFDRVATLSGNEKEPSIYPNPSKGLVMIDFKVINHKNVSVNLFNVLGKELKRFSVKANEASAQVDLSDLPDGVYFMKVKYDSGEKIQRIVLRK